MQQASHRVRRKKKTAKKPIGKTLHFITGQYSWNLEKPDKFQWQLPSSEIKELCTPVKAMELGHAQVRRPHTVFSLTLQRPWNYTLYRRSTPAGSPIEMFHLKMRAESPASEMLWTYKLGRRRRPKFHPQIRIYIYRTSQEECARLRESVPYVKLYRYNPKHLYPKLNGYGDNGHRKVWASGGSTYCTPSVTPYSSTAHARQRNITS